MKKTLKTDVASSNGMTALEDGIYEVVDADQLGFKTTSGWRLVSVLQETEQEMVNETVPQPIIQGQPSTQYGYQVSVGITVATLRSVVLKKHRYLLQKDLTSERGRLAEEVGRLTGELSQSKQLTSEAVAAQIKLTADLELATKQAKAVSTDLAKQLDNLRTMQKTMAEKEALITKLKEDFGKVWLAVGDMKMREVLGGDAENPKPIPDAARKTAYERITSNEEE